MKTQMDHCAPRSHQRIRQLLLSISGSFFLFIGGFAQADDTGVETAQLHLKPGRCVALHQGQVCYQNVQLVWSAPQVGRYCLHQQNAEHPLHCWQTVAAGEYSYAFASDASVQLQLVDAQTNIVIAQATVEVAWVYKANTRRQTHWRLF